MHSNARHTAAMALIKMQREQGYSNLVLDSALQKFLPLHAGAKEAGRDTRRERAFATALFYGVLERMRMLDYYIGRHTNRPINKLDLEVATSLRLAAYQLIYMPSLPERAVLHEAAELVRTLKKSSAAGFVNGVLRAFLRELAAHGGSPAPLPADMPRGERWGVLYSVPEWLVELLLNNYGEADAEGALQVFLQKSPLYIRVNTFKTTPQALIKLLGEAGITAETAVLPHCLRLESPGDITELPGFAEGLFHVQDISSQLCCHALDVPSGGRVLDVCAAPGGKSFTLAQYAGEGGEVVGVDILPARVELIAGGAERLGHKNVSAQLGDAQQHSPQLGSFDRVLCDVPCSGLGVLGRKPEIKEKPPASFADLPQIQYKILETSSKYLKEGGVLVYSTCTLNPAENGEVVARFLAANPQFGPRPLPAMFGEGHEITLLPHKWGSDGFYIAALRRL